MNRYVRTIYLHIVATSPTNTHQKLPSKIPDGIYLINIVSFLALSLYLVSAYRRALNTYQCLQDSARLLGTIGYRHATLRMDVPIVHASLTLVGWAGV
jgi:hypothetical protein